VAKAQKKTFNRIKPLDDGRLRVLGGREYSAALNTALRGDNKT
jgi:hypothetical protein